MKLAIFIRSHLLTLWFFIHTFICAITLLGGSLFMPMPGFANLVIGTLWARPVLWLGLVQVEVRGHEHWPHSGSLVLFNHTSWFDILIMAACLPRVPRFGAKIELFRIPFFGRAMQKSGMLPIERDQRKKVLQVYRDAESRLKNGECFALAPEGTRQTDLEIGRFKQGPFLFAIGAKAQVVPVVIAGAREVMPKTSLRLCPKLWRSKVVMQILPPLSAEGFSEDDLPKLQEQVRQKMIPVYRQLNQEMSLLAPH